MPLQPAGVPVPPVVEGDASTPSEGACETGGRVAGTGVGAAGEDVVVAPPATGVVIGTTGAGDPGPPEPAVGPAAVAPGARDAAWPDEAEAAGGRSVRTGPDPEARTGADDLAMAPDPLLDAGALGVVEPQAAMTAPAMKTASERPTTIQPGRVTDGE